MTLALLCNEKPKTKKLEGSITKRQTIQYHGEAECFKK